MLNSESYEFLIKQLNATGREKMDGYGKDILDCIYDWERDDVEKIMWTAFTQKDECDLAYYMPKLKNYDGMAALKEKLKEYHIPSHGSVSIAEVLYCETHDKYYLDVLIKNYKKINLKVETIVVISRFAKNNDVYSFLQDEYINSDEKFCRNRALRGVLWNKGFISDVDDSDAFSQKRSLYLMFKKDTPAERKEMIEKLDKGELDKYK